MNASLPCKESCLSLGFETYSVLLDVSTNSLPDDTPFICTFVCIDANPFHIANLTFLQLLCDFPTVLLLFPTSCFSLQLNLIHSEISNLAGFEVEAIINPTNADIDLKDDLGKWGMGCHN